MGLIEVEIVKPQAARLVQAMLARLGTPFPTIPTLGPDRLIDEIVWHEPSLDEEPGGLSLAAGTLAARCPISIRHLSIDELRADPGAAPLTAEAVAWVSISAQPGGLRLHLLRIDIDGMIPQHYLPPRRLGEPSLPLAGVSAVAATIVASPGFITLRFGTMPGDGLAGPPADRLAQTGGDWLVRVSGEAIAESFVTQLDKAVAALGSGYELEEAATAEWGPRLDGSWGVTGAIGLVARDMCLGVDISVTLELDARLQPSAETGELTIDLDLATDVSDWDTFRCWLSVGLLGGALMAGIAVPPFLSEIAMVGSVIAVPVVAELYTLDALQSAGQTPGLQKVADTENGAIYRSVSRLPALPTRTVDAVVDGGGLIVSGTTLLVIPEHVRRFEPSGTIAATWSTFVNCGQGSVAQQASLQEITVSDTFGASGPREPIRVFQTSVVEPTHAWRLTFSPFPSVAPRVRVEPTLQPPAPTGTVFLHTSAGLRRLDIGFAEEAPELHEAVITGLLATCRRFSLQWAPFMELLWRPDPPPFAVRFEPLRQWMLTVQALHEGETLTVRQLREGVPLDEDVVLTRQGDGVVSLELVTDKGTTLTLEHEGPARPAIRMVQRWLSPQHAVALPGVPLGLRRTGDTVEVALPEGVLGFSSRTGHTSLVRRPMHLQAEPLASPQPLARRSVTLRELVATTFDGHLWLCTPSPAMAETNLEGEPSA